MTSRQFGGWKQVTTLRPSPGTVIHNACRSVVFFNTRGGPEDPPPYDRLPQSYYFVYCLLHDPL